MMSIICVVALLLLFASYLGYPMALALLTALQRDRKPVAPLDDSELPSVALVVSAFNEVDVIAEKIENSLALDYPPERLSIVVFSDGSDDGTDEAVARFASRGIALRRIDGRVGKTQCQNTVVAERTEDIIVFSDANTMYERDAIRHLVAPFVDPAVASVIGNRRYIGDDTADNQEGLYERFENWLKAKESQLGGTIGACGAIYAVRRADYVPLPADRISDIVEPIVLACSGRRVLYAVDAVGTERMETDLSREMSRKRRIVLRSLNSVWAERRKILSTPVVGLKLILHKVIRWQTLPLLCVVAVFGIIGGNTLLMVLGSGVVLYLAASFAILRLVSSHRPGNVDVPFGLAGRLLLYAIGVFLSAWHATVDFTRGKNQITWQSRS